MFSSQFPGNDVLEARYHHVRSQEIKPSRSVVDAVNVSAIGLIVNPEGQCAGACLRHKCLINLKLISLSELGPIAAMRVTEVLVIDVWELPKVLVRAVAVEFRELLCDVQL